MKATEKSTLEELLAIAEEEIQKQCAMSQDTDYFLIKALKKIPSDIPFTIPPLILKDILDTYC